MYPFAAELFGEVIEATGPIKSSISLAGPSVITPMYTDFPTPTVGMDPSDSPDDNMGPSGTSSDNVGLIVAVTANALLLALVVVGVPLIVIMVMKLRKNSRQRTLDATPTDDSSSG